MEERACPRAEHLRLFRVVTRGGGGGGGGGCSIEHGLADLRRPREESEGTCGGSGGDAREALVEDGDIEVRRRCEDGRRRGISLGDAIECHSCDDEIVRLRVCVCCLMRRRLPCLDERRSLQFDVREGTLGESERGGFELQTRHS